MDERTYNRLSFLFASINHSPHLAERFIDVVQTNAPIPALEAVREQVVGWVSDHGPMDHHGLSVVAQFLNTSGNGDVRECARILAHELDINPPRRN